MPQDSPVSLALGFRIYLPFALGYFLSYVFRVVNAVIAGDLRADLVLDSSVLGLLTSTYFLTFAAFQLPLGYLLDRFGPRRVEASLLLVAALGALPGSPLVPGVQGRTGGGRREDFVAGPALG